MKKAHFHADLYLSRYVFHAESKRKSRHIEVVVLILGLLALPLVSFSTVRYVPSQHGSIQAAIDASSDGDEIIVSPGTYYENIAIGGKNIVLRSTDPTSSTAVATTIIDGGSTDSVVVFSGYEADTCILAGFTIRNGFASGGGGISGNFTEATIQNNVITGNSASWGGGVYCSKGIVRSNTISGNSADGGGGGVSGCEGIIENNVISGNTSGGYGAGVSGCSGIIRNNIISGNSALYGGGGINQCGGAIQNNIITGNSGEYGGGFISCGGIIQNNIIYGNFASGHGGGFVFCEGTIMNNTICGNTASLDGGGLDECRGFIINNIIWGNSGNQLSSCSNPFYSCVQSWGGGGIGNITTDPKFVNPAGADYHLQSDSPCIDAGNVYYLYGDRVVDIDGECRIAGASVDMGSDEYGSSLDSDGDLLSDGAEATHGSDANNSDTDSDGLQDGVEVLRGTNPLVPNTPPGISVPADYAAVQQGLFFAFPSEAIVVSPGTYYENLHLLRKNIILQSADPLNEAIRDTTILDGSGMGSVVTCAGKEGPSCRIRGLTICNGYASLEGGGICGNRALPTIEYNRITDNTAGTYDGFGGGIWGCNGMIEKNIVSNNTCNGSGGGLAECYGTIRDNIIADNVATANYGGGGGLSNCSATMENNLIIGNMATGAESCGGGLVWSGGTFINNTISANSAKYGGGFYGFRGYMTNCIIANNQNYGIFEGYEDDDPTELKYCDIYGNTTGDYYDYDTAVAYSGTEVNTLPEVHDCISADPEFADAAEDDYHIRRTSPCVDAGCAVGGMTDDFEGDVRPYDEVAEPRGDGSDYDIGADEAIWNWLAVFSDHDTPVPSGTTDFTSGTLVSASVQDPTVTEGTTGYVCTGWVGEGAAPSSGTATLAVFVIDRDSTITWQWKTQYYLNATVDPPGAGSVTLEDEVTPATGWYDEQTTVTMLAFGLPGLYAFDHWSGDVSGSANVAQVFMESAKSVTAHFVSLLTPTPTPTPTPAVELVVAYTFDTSTQGWGYSTFTGFSLPTFSSAGGKLSISSGNDSINRFGFWQTAAGVVPYEAEQIYRARYALQTDQLAPGAVPTIRLRFTMENLTGSAAHSIVSQAPYSYGLPTTGTKEYRMLYYPAVADDLGFTFDMLDFDPDEWGTVSLDAVIVEKIARTEFTSPTLVMTYESESDFAAWEWSANFGNPSWSGCTSGQSGGTISITSAGAGSYGQAAFWQSPTNDLSYVADKLYRATFTMSRGAGNAAATMPWCRIRCFNEDGQMSQEFNVNNGSSGAAMPPETPATRDYEVYWQTPDLPASPSTDEDGFRVAIDMLNFAAGESGTHILDSVIIEYAEILPYSAP
jgi:hypothetical protein